MTFTNETMLLYISFEEDDDVSPILPTLMLPSLQNDQLSDNFEASFTSKDVEITFDSDDSISLEN